LTVSHTPPLCLHTGIAYLFFQLSRNGKKPYNAE
jgi:hypothetical protein